MASTPDQEEDKCKQDHNTDQNDGSAPGFIVDFKFQGPARDGILSIGMISSSINPPAETRQATSAVVSSL